MRSRFSVCRFCGKDQRFTAEEKKERFAERSAPTRARGGKIGKIMELYSEGLTIKEIADRLSCSEAIVKHILDGGK